MKRLLILFCTSFLCLSITGQKVFTRTGAISFYSNAPLENIAAHNNKASCVLDIETGKMEWAVLIKAFKFKKALMQEHFNENYMESAKFPKAGFVGSIVNIEDFDLSEDGEYKARVEGVLTIREISKVIDTDAVFQVEEGVVSGSASFSVKVSDYGIKIPQVVRDNIAKEVEIKITASYEQLENKT